MNRPAIEFLGTTHYRSAWDLQKQVLESVQHGAPERIMLTEHYPVYTLGKHGKEDNLLFLPDDTECIRIDRGGDITYHGPGCLVVYPIINLRARKLGVKRYVEILEESVIRTLIRWGIRGERIEGATGVWLDKGSRRERKICAIGVRVSHGVSMHGLALNVSTDLKAFAAINPCGFCDKGVTSIQKELRASPPEVAEVGAVLAQYLSDLI